jgi:hypothetical protein
MVRGFIFGSQGALLFSVIGICFIVRACFKVVKGKRLSEKVFSAVVAIFVCLVFVISTWIALVSRDSGAQRSRVDRNLIAELTEEKIDEGLEVLSEHEWVGIYSERNGDFEHVRSYGFNYKRPTAGYERPTARYERLTGSVNFFMFVYETEEAAKLQTRLSNYKFDYYRLNENEAYLGRSIIPRSPDTFLVGGSSRYIRTVIRVGRYVLLFNENTHSRYLNDLSTNDVLRILAGVE